MFTVVHKVVQRVRAWRRGRGRDPRAYYTSGSASEQPTGTKAMSDTLKLPVNASDTARELDSPLAIPTPSVLNPAGPAGLHLRRQTSSSGTSSSSGGGARVQVDDTHTGRSQASVGARQPQPQPGAAIASVWTSSAGNGTRGPLVGTEAGGGGAL